MHFVRGAFHHSAESMKDYHKTIQLRIQNASRAHTQHEFFEEILTMILDILHNKKEDSSKISDAIDVALYILKVDPSHWSTFARISGFDRDSFETQLTAVVFDLLYVQHWCNNSDYSKRTGLTTSVQFENTLTGESIAAAKSKMIQWKKQRKSIVQSKTVHFF